MSIEEIKRTARLLANGDLSVVDNLTMLMCRHDMIRPVQMQGAWLLKAIQQHVPWSYQHQKSKIIHLQHASPEPPLHYDRYVMAEMVCGSNVGGDRLGPRVAVTRIPRKLCKSCRIAIAWRWMHERLQDFDDAMAYSLNDAIQRAVA